MYIWNELSLPYGKRDGYNKMIGYDLALDSAATTMYIPLEFWFCRNPGLALPLIALQYHEVKVNLEFRPLSELNREATTVITSKSLGATSLWVDYIFLDTDERRRFAQLSHEYLIEQLQFTGEESIPSAAVNSSIKMNFNHPVKELVWIVQQDSFVNASGSNQWFNYTNSGVIGDAAATNLVSTAKIQLNGHDRFAQRTGDYFNLVQPYQHHENVPTSVGINVYSFALKPEEHQPSGTLNFSRIDSAVLKLGLTGGTASKCRIYAVNYNVLRVMSGMGGLAYSN
jgi:hypothetical protein